MNDETKKAKILEAVLDNPGITYKGLCGKTGIQYDKIRFLVIELEKDGFIKASRQDIKKRISSKNFKTLSIIKEP